MNTKINFINGNTKKCLLAMTISMIIAMFLNMAYNPVDSPQYIITIWGVGYKFNEEKP